MCRLFFLFMMIGVASAATMQGPVLKTPAHLAHKEGCYVEEVKDVIAYGSEVAPIGVCMRIECERSMMYYATCGVVSTPDDICHVTEMDLTKPYPDCCPRVKCETENQV